MLKLRKSIPMPTTVITNTASQTINVNEVAIEIKSATPNTRRHEILSKLSSEEIFETIQGRRISKTKVPNRPLLTLAIATGLIA
jgi:hypothetical protein